MTAYELARISNRHFQTTTVSKEQRASHARYEEAKAHQLSMLDQLGKALANTYPAVSK